MPKFKLGNQVANRWRIVKWYNATAKWWSLLLATAAYSGVGSVVIGKKCGGLVRAQFDAAGEAVPRCNPMQRRQAALAQARCLLLPTLA